MNAEREDNKTIEFLFSRVDDEDVSTADVRKRWPRLFGKCPKGCGFDGIGYASFGHYIYGDW